MLVPAMAFAWCVVSMSAPAPHAEPVPSSAAVRSRVHAPPTTDSVAAASDPEGQQKNSEDTTATQEFGDTEPPRGREARRVPVKSVTPAIVRVARTFLDLPMGAERSADVEGRRYVFVLERHYHPPGFVGGPVGYHKGVTVYEFR